MNVSCRLYFGVKYVFVADNKRVLVVKHVFDKFFRVELPAHSFCKI